MAEALLRADPHARVLATSREPLRATGEYVYRVLPLAVPAEGAEDREDLLRCGAVKLFVARAQAMDRRFSLDARSAAIMGAICRRLDGIPLAIELAAARTATLGVEGLAARLDDRFRLLTGGHRTALPRHQTLRATLDWSYELLPAIERTVLRRLAVFAGGFTLEAASAVAAAADLDAPRRRRTASRTWPRSRSWSWRSTGAVTRYRLLETTRAYALEKLDRERRARPRGPTPRRILPGPLRAGGDRMRRRARPSSGWPSTAARSTTCGRRWTGPSRRAATRRSGWRSPPRRCRSGSSSRSWSSVAAAPSARSPASGLARAGTRGARCSSAPRSGCRSCTRRGRRPTPSRPGPPSSRSPSASPTPSISSGRSGACGISTPAAASVAGRWRWRSASATGPPTPPIGPSASGWSALRCTTWETRRMRGSTSSACSIAMSIRFADRTPSAFNTTRRSRPT